eukprot:TRINITY_DN6556_c0_g1_i4.p1 TRINITY_DN6556_c0_g1~~TRINITY_DN6556_c0_g1_i4.p1  ORF type:complete len:301 (+),score=25.96 TRINITY_DN6556_c0_g1_i4:184-1086(+)
MNALRSIQLDALELDHYLVDMLLPRVNAIMTKLAPSSLLEPSSFKPLIAAALKAAALLRWGMSFGQHLVGLTYTPSKGRRAAASWGLLVCLGELLWMALHSVVERISNYDPHPRWSQLVTALRVLDRIRLGVQALHAVRFLYSGRYLRIADRLFNRSLTTAMTSASRRSAAAIQMALWRAGLNALKPAIQVLGLQALHRWLHAVVNGNLGAIQYSTVEARAAGQSAAGPNLQESSGRTGRPTERHLQACVYCSATPPCNVRVLPCRHLACHVCLLDHAAQGGVIYCRQCDQRTYELGSAT